MKENTFAFIENADFYIDHVKNQNAALVNQLAKMKAEAVIAKEKIFSAEFDKFKEYPNDDKMVESFIKDIIKYLKIFCFNHDDEIIERLKQFHIKESTLRWFTLAEDIVKEIRIMEDEHGVIKTPNSKFALIRLHLEWKVAFHLLLEFGFTFVDDRNVERIKPSIIFERKIKNEKRRKKIKGYTDDINGWFDAIIDNIQETAIGFYESRQEGISQYQKQLNGSTNELISIFSLAYFKDTISTRKYCKLLFPLLKLVFKDNELLSEIEFDEKPSEKYSYKSYSDYMAKRVIKILTKK